MKHRLAVLFIFLWAAGALIFFLFALSSQTDAQTTAPDVKLDASLTQTLAHSQPDDEIRVILYLPQKADLARTSLPADELARRTAVIARLQETAAAAQASLITHLDSLKTARHISRYDPFWIINAIAVTGTPTAIQELAAHPDVARIGLDESYPLIEPPALPASEDLLAPTIITPSTSAAPLTYRRNWGAARIRAPHVWHGLGIAGEGVTVAIMDSGVDWFHTDLYANYRGHTGSGVQHAGNWYHTVIPTLTVPIDFVGHGTHVAGIAVGQNGLGVAPGAQWIAVALSDGSGLIFSSSVHRGFEWLLAPNGDPGLAPDIVNGSWGGLPHNTAFLEDVDMLHTAGIITVFAAGNSGPGSETINAPAGYTDTLAIGASDDLDEVPWFSSRGPSPFTDAIQPHILAPGTAIVSAFPNNLYASASGTSMAAPQATGAVALLLSVDPSLSQEAVTQILIDTAVPITTTHPNYDSGWGRLDAYAAVLQETTAGQIRGVVQRNGIPVPGVTITITTAAGQSLPYTSDEHGVYQAFLRPGTYQLTAAPFGYAPVTISNLTLTSNSHTIIQPVHLAPLPTGTITGIVRASGTGEPLPAAVIEVVGAPVSAVTDGSGRYTLTLPQGTYKLIAHASGHRLGRAVILLPAQQTILQHFSLVSAPSILLVDSGQWYYRSYLEYYRDTLTALNYHYDRWSIRNPYRDVPTVHDLAGYDTVIWTAPQDAPGVIGASPTITNYLGIGGNLLISGQNVGSNDGFGFGTKLWWYRDLAARYIGAADETDTLTGAADSLFAGLTFTLNGSDSADNQIEPDLAEPRPGSLTAPLFYYSDGRPGGLQAGHCEPFRIVYLGFGLEGVTAAADRVAILDRSLDYFDLPPTETAMQWTSKSVDDFALLGESLVYTFTIRNLSETMTDTFHFQPGGGDWSTALLTSTLTLGPCETGHTVLTIDVPDDLPRDTVHTMQLTAVSTNDSSLSAILNLRHKIPGRILLVDDDRWYNQEALFQTALDSTGVSYDVWDIGWDNNVRDSPSAAFLQYYDIIVWYTGYDWFEPITRKEHKALYKFMKQGGRLFLTSQDYLYYHRYKSLTSEYMGLLTYQESITPTRTYAGNSHILSNQLAGPIPLTYGPYRNFSDGILPAVGSEAVIWGNQGMAAGVANAGLTPEGKDWRLIFWSIPFETLTKSVQLPAMNSMMGWLGDLGESTFVVDQSTGEVGALRTYTLTLQNLESAPWNEVWVTNTLPIDLHILPQTIVGNAAYDTTTRQLTWHGMLTSNEQHVIRYQAAAGDVPDGTRLDNPITLHYRRHHLLFNQVATTWVHAPDLSLSTLTAVSANTPARQLVTYTLSLYNSGLAATQGISTVVRLPDALASLTPTLQFSQGSGQVRYQRIHWQGDLEPGASLTISVMMTRPVTLERSWLSTTAVIDDGVTDTTFHHHLFQLGPYTYYFPFIAKK